MIYQYGFSICGGDERQVAWFWAYRLYAWLLRQLPTEMGERLHQQGSTPISQYVWFNHDTGESQWVVNLLNDEMKSALGGALDGLAEIPLHAATMRLSRLWYKEESQKHLLECARSQARERCVCLRFVSPTAFKSEGRYGIFPKEKWLLHSLMNSWNALFPDMPLDDADALSAMERGLRIEDYSLKTTRYPLKDVRIASFVGRVWIASRLPAPLEEIWRLLVALAPYTGVGVKTAIGMGGVQEGKAERGAQAVL